MLPEVDIQRWRKLDGYGKQVYGNYWFKKAINGKANDVGHTNNAGMAYVRTINAYLIESSVAVYKLFLVKVLLETNSSFYQRNKVYPVLRGLAKQRKMTQMLKKRLAVNPVNPHQAAVLDLTFKKLNDRLVYIKNVFIPEVTSSTDLLYYTTFLDEGGIEIEEELEKYFGDKYFSMYVDENAKEVKVYLEHVNSIIESMRWRADIAEVITKAKEREDKLYAARVEGAKRRDREIEQEHQETTTTLVDALSSKAQKTFSFRHLPDGETFVLVAGYVPTTTGTKYHVGYGRRTQGRVGITTNYSVARLYATEEEAVSDGEELRLNSLKKVVYNVVPVYRMDINSYLTKTYRSI